MDRARSFDFCQQLPRKTITEVQTSDGIYAHQVLLNETWENYCKRRGKPERASEEHEKWVTETWDEYLNRAVYRSRTLADFDADNDNKIAQKANADGQRAEIGNNVVNMMMAAEDRRIKETRLPCEHTLLLDFEELRQQRFSRERLAIEDEETAKRLWVQDEEETERRNLMQSFTEKRDQMIAAAEAKRRAELEARRKEEEARRKEEERKKAEEEAKRRAELEAERKRRAEEEEAKRAERKRKEDERRAKAKAEREARNKAASMGASRAKSEMEEEATGPIAKARAARMKRMHEAISARAMIDQIRELATNKSESIEEYFSSLVNLLGNGSTFFHTCVYVGCVVDETNLDYIAASENCSEKLRSGEAQNTAADSPTLVAMLKNPRAMPHFGPMPCSPPLVHVGSLPHWPPEHGEAAFFPIIVNDQLWGVLAIDTAQNNLLDPESTFRLPEEADCYDGSGPLRNCSDPVSITPEMCSFLEEVAKISAAAAAALPSSRVKKISGLNFDIDNLRGAKSLGNLMSLFTFYLNKASKNEDQSFDCYISMINNSNDSSTIVTHNGFSIVDSQGHPDRDPQVPHHLVGSKLADPSAKTFSLPTTTNSHYFAEDVSSDDSLKIYDRALNQNKAEVKEPLLLIPVVVGGDDNSSSKLWGAVGITGSALNADLVPSLVELFWGQVRPLILASLKRSTLTAVCSQALEWLSIATGVKNVYIALTHARDKKSSTHLQSSALEIVKASDKTQKFLEGKVWTSKDGGLSHDLISGAAGHTHEPTATSKHLSSLANNNNIKFFNDKVNNIGSSPEAEQAQLILCSISQNKPDANIHGVLCGDTLRPGSQESMKDQTISSSDAEIFRLTAQILAATLDGEDVSTENPRIPLAIEKELSSGKSEKMGFLSRLFQHAADSVRGITGGQLSELARYPAPPAVIPTTVASAIVLLGSSKQSTEWAEVRKKIKQELLDKIVKFDPTGKKVKKSCVIRSKKLTKGLTASDVFTKGSHPASCLFTWVFISLLLRKFAKNMRDQESDESENINAVLSAGGLSVSADDESGSAAVSPREDEDEDDDDEGENDDDGEDDDDNEEEE